MFQILLIILFVLAICVAGGVVFVIFKRKKFRKNLITSSLAKPRSGFVDPIKKLFLGESKAIKEILPHLEEVLLQADVGVKMTATLIDALQAETSIKSAPEAYEFLKKKILDSLTILQKTSVGNPKPNAIFFVGINGTGKTTTIGKLAAAFKSGGKKVLVVGADTFRAAAGDQLKVWAERSGVDFVGGEPEVDPASVVYNGIAAAIARGMDVVMVDTAGRLHTKTSLMEELKKMHRVATKELGHAPDDIWLVLDATTGQNGLNQAKVFGQALPLTGLILTKYDGTAKGGIILSITSELGLPVKYLGEGEGIGDLKPFEPHEFVEELFK
ncbi:MAG: hypothetical protein ACD_73C00472G0004 [uncultured bacterium]|nr:MAG: hypothetical protein ACD_73C00472G0004 [uncultured bacterium]